MTQADRETSDSAGALAVSRAALAVLDQGERMSKSKAVTLSRELDMLSKINELSKKINSTLELSQIIKHTIQGLPEMLSAGKCSIFLYEPEKEEL